MTLLKKGLFVAATAAFSVAATANPLANVNGNVSLLAGDLDAGTDIRATAVSVSVPVFAKVGVQLDGMYGERGNESTARVNPDGGAAHVYARNDQGLVGVLYTYSDVSSARTDVETVGLEGEYYLGRATFKASTGLIDKDSEGEYFGLQSVIYPDENLALSIYAAKGDLSDGADDVERFGLTAEYETPVNGLAVFANVAEGNDSYESATAGVRYYLGSSTNLMQRHRSGDLDNAFTSAISPASIAR